MLFKDLQNSHPKLMSVALFGAGFAVATILFRYRNKFRVLRIYNSAMAETANNKQPKGEQVGESKVVSNEYKMVLVVRNDLKMGKGKIAAQCAHAAVGAVEKLAYENMAALRQWQRLGQTKVVLKVEDERSLRELAKTAQSNSINTCLVSDAGRTQIAPGSKTVLAVGPGPASLVDQITGHLKLL